MGDKILFKNKESYILIKNGKVAVIKSDSSSYSPKAIRIAQGFQIELGRKMAEIIQAVRASRLPIIIKQIPIPSDSIGRYKIIRMHTGKVDDKVIANISTKDDLIISVSFNRELITDAEYRKYNQLSAVHQLSIPDCSDSKNNRMYRIEQVKDVLKNNIIMGLNNVEVVEDNSQVVFNINIGNQEIIKFLFLHNKSRCSFDLISISLIK